MASASSRPRNPPPEKPGSGASAGSGRGATDAFPRREVVFLVLAGTFLTSLIVANLITAKLFVLFGVTLAAGIIPYPVTFLATDLICEVYGRRRANTLVAVGFFLSLYVLLILKLGQYAEPFEGLDRQREYEVIFGSSARAIVASMVAYLVAQLIDVRLFHFWKGLTGGKHLWLRNNASTMLSQLVDTVLVVSILFWGQIPTADLLRLMVAGYLFKFVVAAADTPFFYFGARYLPAWVSTRVDAVEGSGPEGSAPARDLRRDLAWWVAALANISVAVGAAVRWGEVGHGYEHARGIALLAMSALAHVLVTVALARPEAARGIAAGLSLIGAAGILAATSNLAHGAGPAAVLAAASVQCACGLSLLFARRGRFR